MIEENESKEDPGVPRGCGSLLLLAVGGTFLGIIGSMIAGAPGSLGGIGLAAIGSFWHFKGAGEAF